MRNCFILIAALIVGASLSACTAAPAPTRPDTVPTSSPSGTAKPSDTAVPAAPVAPAGILIGPESTDLIDAKGDVLLSLRYADDGDAAVVATTALLGEPTAKRHQDKSNHFPATDGTSWGGFEIVVNRYTQDFDAELEDYRPSFSVQADALVTDGDVPIAAVNGTGVGDSFDELAAGKSAAEFHDAGPDGGRSVALSVATSFPGIVGGPGQEMAYGVIAWSEAGGNAVMRIVSPGYLYSQA